MDIFLDSPLLVVLDVTFNQILLVMCYRAAKMTTDINEIITKVWFCL